MPAFAGPRGHGLARMLRAKGEEALREELRSSGCLGMRNDSCCCWIILLTSGFPWVFAPFAFLASALQQGKPMLAMLTLVGLIVVGVIIWGVHRAERQATRRRLHSEMNYHMAYMRRVLFDECLLALVLSEDPYDAVPGVGQVAGIPGSQVLTRRGKAGAGALAERIQVLAQHFGRICEHYRVGLMPVESALQAGQAYPERLKGTAYSAYLLVLAEGILGERVDVEGILGR